MKGMVFTEFMEMVEARWSLDMVDDIIARSGVASGGAYTAVGTYPHQEIVALTRALSDATGIAVADLVRAYGKHLFGRFVILYPHFFHGARDSMGFLAGIEDIIHAEVLKLYPDAELPSFHVERGADRLVLTYVSARPFADLAHGLIDGCVAHFGDAVRVQREAPPDGAPGQARFVLVRA
jgi:hypothetical protein